MAKLRGRARWVGATCGGAAMLAVASMGAPAAASPVEACAQLAPMADPQAAPRWNGWGVDETQSRFQPAAMAGLDAAAAPRLKLKWAFGFPGATRAVAQPTIMGGRLFVGGVSGTVYALDAKAGCVVWRFDADAGVRTAIVLGRVDGRWTAFFGDGRANVYALDAQTGQQIWKQRVDDHATARMTGAPVLLGERLIAPVSSTEEFAAANPFYVCCSFRGGLAAIDARTGKLAWKSYTIATTAAARATGADGRRKFGPSGAAIWASPTIDSAAGAIYAVTGDNYSDPATQTSDAILAFDLSEGGLKWSRQITQGDVYNVACDAQWRENCPAEHGADLDFGASAILVRVSAGRRVLVAGQKSGVVTAVDPDRAGEIVWQRRIGAGGPFGGVQWGMASDGTKIYAAVSDVKFQKAARDAPGAQGAVFDPELAFLVDAAAGGGLHALDAATGREVWSAPHPGCNAVPGCSPAQSAAVTATPGLVFSGGLDGHMRAYAADSGKILWDENTAREYRTTNGIVAHGGSIDGAGAVVVDGVVYVTSGSAFMGTMPGNVLLAFTVDGK